jgi:hypothetical protein
MLSYCQYEFHGVVVATMLGIPAIGLITTDKFHNFYRRIERLDLRGHHSHLDLDERLPKYLAPISSRVRQELGDEARQGLDLLRIALESREV